MSKIRSNGRFSLPHRFSAQPAPGRPRSSKPRIRVLEVVPHPKGWAVMADDIDEPAWVLRNKKRCVASARDAAQDLGCVLQVRTREGRLERTRDFGEGGT